MLFRRLRDWRVLFFTAMLGFMASRQILTVVSVSSATGNWSVNPAGQLVEIPGLVVSVMAFLAVFFLGRFLEEQLDAAEALRNAESRFRLLGENIDEAFWLVSPEEDRLLYVSPAYETVTGRSCQSLYDDPFSWIECVHPEDRAPLQMLQAQLNAGEAHHEDRSRELRLVRSDGEVRWVWMRSHPVRDRNGEIVGRVGVAVDVTEQRESERVFHALVGGTSSVVGTDFFESSRATSPKLLVSATSWSWTTGRRERTWSDPSRSGRATGSWTTSSTTCAVVRRAAR